MNPSLHTFRWVRVTTSSIPWRVNSSLSRARRVETRVSGRWKMDPQRGEGAIQGRRVGDDRAPPGGTHNANELEGGGRHSNLEVRTGPEIHGAALDLARGATSTSVRWLVPEGYGNGLAWYEKGAHLALTARVSWNSYDQMWPDGPTVRATE